MPFGNFTLCWLKLSSALWHNSCVEMCVREITCEGRQILCGGGVGGTEA